MDELEFIRILNAADNPTKWRMLSKLKEMKNELVEYLITLLESSDSNMRMYAASALRYANDARIIEPLIRLLDDKDPDVCVAAIRSLSRTKDPRVVPALVKMLKHPHSDVHNAAIIYLAEMGDVAVPEVIKTLEDREIRPFVIAILEKLIKASDSIEKLDAIKIRFIEVFNSQRSMRTIFVTLLKEINTRKNQLFAIDIQLDKKFKPPSGKSSEIYRARRVVSRY